MLNQERNGADALLETLLENGLDRLFVNLGTDHAGLVEALARREQQGQPNPQIFICPHEMFAISAAHGLAAITQQPQALLVHVDCGTQNLGGGIHNAFRGRVPLLLLAGTAPMTTRGELKGSRTDFVTYVQDVNDQNGIVRQYMRWDYKLPTGVNLPEIVQRALQLAAQPPQGPVYLSFPREVMEDKCLQPPFNPAQFQPARLSVPDQASLESVARMLVEAKKPLIITSYGGRNPAFVPALRELSEVLAAGVCEVRSKLYLNFPADHPHYLGVIPERYFKETDLFLLLDVDIPWIPGKLDAPADAKIIQLDYDPLKPDIPLWTFPADLRLQANSALTLPPLTELCRQLITEDEPERADRREYLAQQHASAQAEREQTAREALAKGVITPDWLSYCLNEIVGENTVVVDEGVSNRLSLLAYLRLNRPGSYLGHPGTALGWANGAAFGVKLAQPQKEVIAVMGDGSFNFSVPNAVYWAANRYAAPFLTVVYNNQGWNAVKLAALEQYPEGYASQSNQFNVRFEQPVDIPALARACHAWAEAVSDPSQLPGLLEQALEQVRAGKAAVLDVHLPPV